MDPVKNHILSVIEQVSKSSEIQLKNLEDHGVGHSVSEIIESWFDYMPRMLFRLLDEKVIDEREVKLLAEFHGYIDALSLEILKNPDGSFREYSDEKVFKIDKNWARLREKARLIVSELNKNE